MPILNLANCRFKLLFKEERLKGVTVHSKTDMQIVSSVKGVKTNS